MSGRGREPVAERGRERPGDVPAIWVTRPAPGNARTASALLAAGHRVICVPVLEVRLNPPSAFPASTSPDWIVFVSANAVEGFEATASRLGFPGAGREGIRVAVVGEETRRRAEARGWRVALLPETESAEGLIEAFTPLEIGRRSVWIPSGNRGGSARDRLPEALTARGARVASFRVYETLTRTLSPRELAALDAVPPGGIVLHSPSAAEAVWDAEAPASVRRWRAALAVTLGAATAARARALGATRVLECERPGDDAVIEALAPFVPERNPS